MKVSLPVVFLFALFGLASCKFNVIDPLTPRESGSARLAAMAASDYRGVYVDGFKDILGNSVREDSLLNWCVNHNFNAISLYDLNTVLGDERYTALAQFISKARVSFGIQQVAAVRGSSANFTQNARYDASRSN